MKSPYGTYFWRSRAKAFLERNPLCRHCLARGVLTVATDADHVQPWRTLEEFKTGALQPLCKKHHGQKTGHDKTLAAGEQKTRLRWF